jgi:hypothetical protein
MDIIERSFLCFYEPQNISWLTWSLKHVACAQVCWADICSGCTRAGHDAQHHDEDARKCQGGARRGGAHRDSEANLLHLAAACFFLHYLLPAPGFRWLEPESLFTAQR